MCRELLFDFSQAEMDFSSRAALLVANGNDDDYYERQVEGFLKNLDAALKIFRKKLRKKLRRKFKQMRSLDTSDPDVRSMLEWAYAEVGKPFPQAKKKERRKKPGMKAERR